MRGPGRSDSVKMKIGQVAILENLEVLRRHVLRHDDDAAEAARLFRPPFFRRRADQQNCRAEGGHDGLRAADHFGHGPMLGGLGRFHQDAEIAMDAGRASVGKSALAMLAIDEAAIFQVAQARAGL